MIINFNNLGGGEGGGGSYTLPVASASVLGGVKIGQGISIDQDGAISAQGGKNDIVLDIAELGNMSYADRKVLWDEVYEKILAGHRIYAKGEVAGELGNYAYLPLEKYKAKTNSLNNGFLFFAVKDAKANIYLHFEFTSVGNLSGLDVDSRLSPYDIYSLPQASSNTLGGVKIGSGISIDQDGVISAQGGGTGGYNIVSELPSSANNGELFFIPSHNIEAQYNLYIFDCSNFSEGGDVLLYGLKGKNLYYEGNGGNFLWDWDNNENTWKYISAWGWYKVDRENRTFYAAFKEEFTFDDLNPQAQLTTGTTAFTETVASETYRYTGTAFTKEDSIFYFGNDNFNRLMSLKENGVDLSQLIYIYDKSVGVFDHYDNIENKFIFKLSDITYNPIGTPLIEENRWLKVKENGTDVEDSSKHPLPMNVDLDLSSSGLSTGLWVRTVAADPQWPANPIVLRATDNHKAEIWSQNVWFRPYYNAESGTWESLTPSSGDLKIFGAEFYYKGKKIVAEWIVNGEGASTVMKWTETEMSTANSTPPQA